MVIKDLLKLIKVKKIWTSSGGGMLVIKIQNGVFVTNGITLNLVYPMIDV
jgi:hypothetical protein